jgi:hypothetical protein
MYKQISTRSRMARGMRPLFALYMGAPTVCLATAAGPAVRFYLHVLGMTFRSA